MSRHREERHAEVRAPLQQRLVFALLNADGNRMPKQQLRTVLGTTDGQLEVVLRKLVGQGVVLVDATGDVEIPA